MNTSFLNRVKFLKQLAFISCAKNFFGIITVKYTIARYVNIFVPYACSTEIRLAVVLQQ